MFYFRPGSVDAINIHSLKCPTNNTGIHHQHHTDDAEKVLIKSILTIFVSFKGLWSAGSAIASFWEVMQGKQL